MSETTITAFDNGPLMVSNPPKLTGAHGEIDAGERAVLCRCGQSKNKPFCDGTHYDVGWRDDAETPS